MKKLFFFLLLGSVQFGRTAESSTILVPNVDTSFVLKDADGAHEIFCGETAEGPFSPLLNIFVSTQPVPTRLESKESKLTIENCSKRPDHHANVSEGLWWRNSSSKPLFLKSIYRRGFQHLTEGTVVFSDEAFNQRLSFRFERPGTYLFLRKSWVGKNLTVIGRFTVSHGIPNDGVIVHRIHDDGMDSGAVRNIPVGKEKVFLRDWPPIFFRIFFVPEEAPLTNLKPKKLSVDELLDLWKRLGSTDQNVPQEALLKLSEGDGETASWLGTKLYAPLPPFKTFTKYFNDLGNDAFDIRQEATDRLIELARQYPEMIATYDEIFRQGELSEDAEVKHRTSLIFEAVGSLLNSPPQGDLLRRFLVVEVLRRMGTKNSRFELERFVSKSDSSALRDSAMRALSLLSLLNTISDR